jgi:hypothetical protein
VTATHPQASESRESTLTGKPGLSARRSAVYRLVVRDSDRSGRSAQRA